MRFFLLFKMGIINSFILSEYSGVENFFNPNIIIVIIIKICNKNLMFDPGIWSTDQPIRAKINKSMILTSISGKITEYSIFSSQLNMIRFHQWHNFTYFAFYTQGPGYGISCSFTKDSKSTIFYYNIQLILFPPSLLVKGYLNKYVEEL